MKTGWQTKKLGDLCIIGLGKTPYRGNQEYWDEDKQTCNVWLSIADLLNTEGRVVFDSKEYISEKGAKLSKIVRKGTLLVSFKLTLGRLAFAGKDLFTNEAIASLSIKNDSEITKDYLYYYLSYFDWDSAVKGDIKIKGKTLNKSKLRELPVSFPVSLTEQNRLVKILEEVLEMTDKAKENAQKNLQNSKDLCESYLNNLVNKELDRKDYKKFGEYIEFLTDFVANGSFASLRQNVKYQKEKGFALLVRLTDLRKNLVLGDNVYVSESAYKFLKKSSLHGNEYLIANVGANIGDAYLMPKINYPATLGPNMLLVKFNNKLDTNFVHAINDLIIKPQIINASLGAAQPKINKDQFRNIRVPVPSLKTQTDILVRYNEIYLSTQKLENIYLQKIADLEILKKSVLNQAFSGNL
jgi:type I restriction enzyme S subunit